MRRLMFLPGLLMIAACTTGVAGPDTAAAYLGTHPTTASSIARAIRDGHVIAAMDREQVVASVGAPIRRQTYGDYEVWLYRSDRFHQGAASHGATLVRMTFNRGRVASIEYL